METITERKYTVAFSSLSITVVTTIEIETSSETSYDDLHEKIIRVAEEQINHELGVNYTDYCHSVHVEEL